jgi:hypothetical protein
MSLEPGSEWRIHRDSVPDQVIKITGNDDERFTAEYVGIDNPSEFTGEVWARHTKVINIKQHDHTTSYVAFCSGLRDGTNNNRYEGNWFDNAGNSGTFRLTRR